MSIKKVYNAKFASVSLVKEGTIWRIWSQMNGTEKRDLVGELDETELVDLGSNGDGRTKTARDIMEKAFDRTVKHFDGVKGNE